MTEWIWRFRDGAGPSKLAAAWSAGEMGHRRCIDPMGPVASLELASGKYDALSGGYFELPDDLEALLKEKAAA